MEFQKTRSKVDRVTNFIFTINDDELIGIPPKNEILPYQNYNTISETLRFLLELNKKIERKDDDLQTSYTRHP